MALGWGAGELLGEGIGGCSFVFTRLIGDGKGMYVVGGLFVFSFEFWFAMSEFALLLAFTIGEGVASVFAFGIFVSPSH